MVNGVMDRDEYEEYGRKNRMKMWHLGDPTGSNPSIMFFTKNVTLLTWNRNCYAIGYLDWEFEI